MSTTPTTPTTQPTPSSRAGRTPLGPGFRRLWWSSTISNIGDGVVLAALPLVAAEVSRHPAAVAGVTVAATLPWLVFGLLAGVVVDRFDRIGVMRAVDVGRAGVVAAIALLGASGWLSLPGLFALVFVLGMGEALFDTAAQAVLPELVAADRLEDANGRLFGAQIVANQFAGPPLGGALFGLAVALPFAADAVSFALSAALLIGLRRRAAPSRRRQAGSVLQEVREGLTWLGRDRTIRAFAVGAGVVNVAHTGATAVLVLFAEDELGLGDLGFGLLLAGAAIGSVIGSLASGWVSARLGRRTAVLASVGAFAVALLGLAASTTPVAAAAALALFGAAGEVWNVIAVSYRQAAVPPELLGRIMASYRVVAYGALPVGAALGGIVATAATERVAFAAGGLLVAGLGAYLAIALTEADMADR